MTSLATGIDNPAFEIEEPGEIYQRLLMAARHVASVVVKTPRESLESSALYIHHACQELVSTVDEDAGDAFADDGAVFECLRRVLSLWPDIAARRVEGEQVFSGDPGLWKRAMTEWPMGGYAKMAADFMIEHKLLGGKVVELGAGVGSCSALVASHVSDAFIRTDLQPFLLKRQKIAGTVERYDFNEPGPWSDRDTIFSVNAVHCAKDKTATAGHLLKMLRPGGVLVLGEGNPHTKDDQPWALNPFFGLFRGWWDVGGFVSRNDWFASLRDAGFTEFGYASRRAGQHDLGGVLWAVK